MSSLACKIGYGHVKDVKYHNKTFATRIQIRRARYKGSGQVFRTKDIKLQNLARASIDISYADSKVSEKRDS